jgi:peptidoglycan/LPS O-acetylase OafA/YrhL
MDETVFVQALTISLVFGIVVGALTARSSYRREPIYGGVLAHVLHIAGAIAYAAVLPAVLSALILGGGFRTAAPLALALVATSLLALTLFAVVERPVRNQRLNERDESGWTEEDARTSGL